MKLERRIYSEGFNSGLVFCLKLFSKQDQIRNRYKYYLDQLHSGKITEADLLKDNEFLTTQKLAKKLGVVSGDNIKDHINSLGMNTPSTNTPPTPKPTTTTNVPPTRGSQNIGNNNTTNRGGKFNQIKTDVGNFIKKNPIKTAGIGLGVTGLATAGAMLGSKNRNNRENQNSNENNTIKR